MSKKIKKEPSKKVKNVKNVKNVKINQIGFVSKSIQNNWFTNLSNDKKALVDEIIILFESLHKTLNINVKIFGALYNVDALFMNSKDINDFYIKNGKNPILILMIPINQNNKFDTKSGNANIQLLFDNILFETFLQIDNILSTKFNKNVYLNLKKKVYYFVIDN
jgi:hypothetical protein